VLVIADIFCIITSSYVYQEVFGMTASHRIMGVNDEGYYAPVGLVMISDDGQVSFSEETPPEVVEEINEGLPPCTVHGQRIEAVGFMAFVPPDHHGRALRSIV